MKRTLLSLFAVAATVAGSSIAISSGSGPISGMTGAPNESTCAQCHTPTNGPATVSMHVRPTGTAYVPGSPSVTCYKADTFYTVRVMLDNGVNPKAGFQSTVIRTSNSTSSGILLRPGTQQSTQNGTVNGGTRKYVQHTAPKNGGTNFWEYEFWVPTISGNVGDLHIYTAVNNAINSSSGDVKLVNMPIAVCGPTSVKETAALSAFKVYPNPAGQHFSLSFDSQQGGKAQLRVLNLAGAVVADLGQHELAAGANQLRLSFDNKPAAGTYLLQVELGGRVATTKLNVI